jgi:hypothetical protein
MISLRFDDGAARHDGQIHFVIAGAKRPGHFVIEVTTC